MKKILFSFTLQIVLSLTVVSSAFSQSYPFFYLTQYSNLNILSVEIPLFDKSDLEIENESRKKEGFQKTDDLDEIKKDSKSNIQPSSTKISIGLGKALFEKYIK